jgi:hypothetical protein
MDIINRRTAIVGAGAAAVALGGLVKANAQGAPAASGGTRPPAEEGVTRTDLNQGPSMIPGYKQVTLSDITIAPGKKFGPNPMNNAMVCHMLEGELEITQSMGGGTFTAKKNHVWTCMPGMTEGGVNKGTTPATMRITQLLP